MIKFVRLFRYNHVLQHFFGYSVPSFHVLISVSRIRKLSSTNSTLFVSDAMNLAVVSLGLVQVAVSLRTYQAPGLAII